MISALSVQVAFLIFEAVFCFIAAFLALCNIEARRRVRYPVAALNALAGILLVADSFAYIFQGGPTTLDHNMAYLCNSICFFVCALLVPVYATYAYIQLFKYVSVKRKAQARIRLLTCYYISVCAFVLVIISQFTDIYFYLDSANNYHRGPLFTLSVILPLAATALVFSVLVQYHARISRRKFLVLTSYIFLSTLGLLLQILFYGMSYMNMGIGLSAMLMFIDSILDKNEELRHAATTEFRTGLANEHGCLEWLNSKQHHVFLPEYAAVFFDLCKFSDINRKYGMEIGNDILSLYVDKLSEYLEKDELLARQYGNQFVAIIKKTNLDHFLTHLEGLDIQFNNPADKSIATVTISAKAGVYEIRQTDSDGEEIISYAASALGLAKTPGGKPVVYMTPELIHTLKERKLLETEIQNGLENDEFVVYYQPKVDSSTQTLCGAEALARWLHNGELIQPARFIPLMESNETICLLDLKILQFVCRDLSSWISQGLKPPTVSVNISRRNLSDPDIANKIDHIIKAAGIPKELIEIEITETVDEFPIRVLKSFVDSLHELGYRVSIDDFGTASSSLTLLREITFDTIKIDKGFVDKDFAKDLTILDYIVKLAKALDLRIVAEGVEHAEQVATLLNMGVIVIQGYFFDEPLPHEEMTKRLRSPIYSGEA